jgi:putative addiction module component (TIGR02574 family)
MSVDLHALAGAALSLDPADRLSLASLLIDSVEESADPDWEAAWTQELKRRSAAADGRAVRGAPWDEVRARLLRDLSSR